MTNPIFSHNLRNFHSEQLLSHMKFAPVTESSTMKNPAPKLIWAMLVFLSLGHTKTKENQMNSELPELKSKLHNSV